MAQPSQHDIDTLARQAVACKGWRWMPGMRWTNPPKSGGYGPLDGGGRLDETEATYLWPPEGSAPDLDDPATRGCLLALVREAWKDPYLCVVGDPETGWRIDAVTAQVDDLHSYVTEVEVLVVALRSVP